MTGSDAHLNEIGEFLKARRSELTPEAVGLPDTAAVRRVPGLRREEVAQLAAISNDYYTRLEQGRIKASAPVLTSLARVLRLDDVERVYLFKLAGKQTARPRRRTAQKVRPQLQRLLDQLTDVPAVIFGRRMDILAWNALAAALITDFSAMPPERRNYVRLLFTEPGFREYFKDWEVIARYSVAHLRLEAAEHPDDPALAALVGELSVQDAEFRSWWAEHQVATKAICTKIVDHPVVGEMTLNWDMFAHTGDPDQQLVLWSAEPGTASHEALKLLGSWSVPEPSSSAPRPS
jgi:transcriptional regulator with XRE-family HTH domain